MVMESVNRELCAWMDNTELCSQQLLFRYVLYLVVVVVVVLFFCLL